MKKTYDALVMPTNYAVMSEEEMTYLEGGAVEYSGTLSDSYCLSAYNYAVKYSTFNALANVIGALAVGKAIAAIASVLESGEIDHPESTENNQIQSTENSQCTSFSFLLRFGDRYGVTCC